MRKKRLNSLVFIAGVVCFVGMAVYLVLTGEKKGETASSAHSQPVKEVPKAGAEGEAALIETNPVLPASDFTGRAATTYRYASEIPKAIDGLYCYCQCKENPRFKHKTLLTCFTNNHAAECDTCMQEAEMAYEMSKEGKSVKEIRAAVDAYYEKRKSEF